MSFIVITKNDSIATVMLNRGKVNALNEHLVEQLDESLRDLEKDNSVQSLILTGQGKFFSFGFDIPEFLEYSKDSFITYLTKFTNLLTHMFLFPKPIIAALNGHTIAGGCMLAVACDYRIMVSGKTKISLNEITFGSSVFAGSVEMLKYTVGGKNAESILYSGTMYRADEALQMGLIDLISAPENLTEEARKVALDFSNKYGAAFKSMKSMLRSPVLKDMASREKDSIREFADIWYSKEAWKNLENIKIHN